VRPNKSPGRKKRREEGATKTALEYLVGRPQHSGWSHIGRGTLRARVGAQSRNGVKGADNSRGRFNLSTRASGGDSKGA